MNFRGIKKVKIKVYISPKKKKVYIQKPTTLRFFPLNSLLHHHFLTPYLPAEIFHKSSSLYIHFRSSLNKISYTHTHTYVYVCEKWRSRRSRSPIPSLRWTVIYHINAPIYSYLYIKLLLINIYRSLLLMIYTLNTSVQC